MPAGTQFTGGLDPGQYQVWFTSGWAREFLVRWSVRPSSGQVGNVVLRALTVEAAQDGTLTYHLTVWNIGSTPVTFDALYEYNGLDVTEAGVYGQGEGGTAQGVSPGLVGKAGTNASNDGVQGFGSGNFSGVAGFGDSKGGGTGVFGNGIGPQSAGVRGIGGGGPNTVPVSPAGLYGQAGSGNANGVEGRGSGTFAGVAGFGDVSSTSGGGIGVFAVGGAPPAGSSQPGGPGVYGVGYAGPPYAPLAQAAGVYGIGGVEDAPGVLGQGGSAVANGVQGFSASGSGINGQSNSGVGVRAFSSSGTGVVAEGNTSVPGTIGLIATGRALAGQFNGNVLVNGDFTVLSGKKSVAVSFPDGSHRLLYCVESPESWFEDFGFGELVNGHAQVQLDVGFSSLVVNDSYHVFISEYEGNSALYVTKRTATGFVVQAKEPKANGIFSYRVVAKRKDNIALRFEQVSLPKEIDNGPRQGRP